MAEKDSITAEKYFISAIYLCVGAIFTCKVWALYMGDRKQVLQHYKQ